MTCTEPARATPLRVTSKKLLHQGDCGLIVVLPRGWKDIAQLDLEDPRCRNMDVSRLQPHKRYVKHVADLDYISYVESFKVLVTYSARMRVAMTADSTSVVAFPGTKHSAFWIETLFARARRKRSLAKETLNIEVVVICA
jgi:hypothetical protein